MGMADIRKAFQSALNGKADCQQATMQYSFGGRQQTLAFVVTPHGGTETTIANTVSSDVNLVAHAKLMAANYVATLGG